MKQREVTELDVQSGLVVEFDNGDIGNVSVGNSGEYLLEVHTSPVGWRPHGILTKSKNVMANLIYVYPSEEL